MRTVLVNLSDAAGDVVLVPRRGQVLVVGGAVVVEDLDTSRYPATVHEVLDATVVLLVDYTRRV